MRLVSLVRVVYQVSSIKTYRTSLRSSCLNFISQSCTSRILDTSTTCCRKQLVTRLRLSVASIQYANPPNEEGSSSSGRAVGRVPAVFADWSAMPKQGSGCLQWLALFPQCTFAWESSLHVRACQGAVPARCDATKMIHEIYIPKYPAPLVCLFVCLFMINDHSLAEVPLWGLTVSRS